jgi:hypothetical protein
VSSARRSWTTSAGSAGSTPRRAPSRGDPTRCPSTRTATSPPSNRVLPKTLPADADPITKIFFDYYRTERGYHPRSINSTTAWTATTPMSFFAFRQMTNIDMLAPRKALLVAGAEAHSLYYSEDVQAMAPDTVDLVIVPGADHVDLRPQGPHPLRQARRVLHQEPRLTGSAPDKPVPPPACRGAPVTAAEAAGKPPSGSSPLPLGGDQGGAGTARLSKPRPSFGVAAVGAPQLPADVASVRSPSLVPRRFVRRIGLLAYVQEAAHFSL